MKPFFFFFFSFCYIVTLTSNESPVKVHHNLYNYRIWVSLRQILTIQKTLFLPELTIQNFQPKKKKKQYKTWIKHIIYIYIHLILSLRHPSFRIPHSNALSLFIKKNAPSLVWRFSLPSPCFNLARFDYPSRSIIKQNQEDTLVHLVIQVGSLIGGMLSCGSHPAYSSKGPKSSYLWGACLCI